MKNKLKSLFLCIALIFCVIPFNGCKFKLNYPEIWYIYISLNGATYTTESGYSPTSNIMKPVDKNGFSHGYSMPDPKTDILAPEGKVFAGWYFDNIENNFANNWTEINWINACNKATADDENKHNVSVYAKWVDEGDAVLALNGGSDGHLKSDYLQSNNGGTTKVTLDNFNLNSFIETLPTKQTLKNYMTFPLYKTIDENWYLKVDIYNSDNNIALTKENIATQIETTGSAYVEILPKWESCRVVYFEITSDGNLPEELWNSVYFTDNYFDTRAKELTIGGSSIQQTNTRMMVYAYIDELEDMTDVQFNSIFPKETDVEPSEFERNFDGKLYFFVPDGNGGEIKKILTRENVIDYIDGLNALVYDQVFTYIYLDWDQKITFNFCDEGATQNQIITNKCYEKLTEPQPPTREGFNFIGWSKSEYFQDLWNFETDLVKGDTTLFAVWEEE